MSETLEISRDKRVRVCLYWADFQGVCVCVCVFPFFLFFFFSFFSHIFDTCSYCSCTVQWTVTTKFDFSNFFQLISAHRVLFTDPQISLFSNFSLKMGPTVLVTHLKIILLQCFSVFSFNFQFSTVSKRTLSVDF